MQKNKVSFRGLPKPLSNAEVFSSCKNTNFNFKTTKEVKTGFDIYSQDRALRAIEMGLGIRRPGYNIYVAGVEGTGKTSVIKQFLETWSKNQGAPDDWLYLFNFQDHSRPTSVRIKRGEGKKFKKKMENLVKTLSHEIPSALQSEDYETALNSFFSTANEKKSKLYAKLERKAKSMDFALKSTKIGIETIPVVNGRQMTDKDYNKLTDAERDEVEAKRMDFEPFVLEFVRKVRKVEKDTQEQSEALRADLADQIVSHIMAPLIEEYEENQDLSEYLTQVQEDVTENILEFVPAEEKVGEDEVHMLMAEEKDHLARYKVNVFVDNSRVKQAPVIIENHPTFYNLFGKIEKNVEHGMFLTDFTMIKSGSIHKANGGYLVLNVLDIFKSGNTWEHLKRILRNRKGFIEDLGEQQSMLPTSGIRPDPIPLDLKVILIGTDEIYHILYHDDEEFHKVFKIKADFDYKMDRTKKNINAYVSFIATRSEKEGLLPFDKTGVAAVVEYGSRLVEHQKLLSTQFGVIKDLTIEADFLARQNGSRLVKRVDVEQAIEEKFNRLNLAEQGMMEHVGEGQVLLSLSGTKVGQINGLAVYDYGDHSFGKISRITATSYVSGGGVINVERESRMSGAIHDKGVAILSGYLNAIFAKNKATHLTARICFEQNYGGIDGDSASAAELIAILSSFSGIPIRQNLAITGSVNQFGEIQPIGGVNEKIEGFYKVASKISRASEYIVMIPVQNTKHLMLDLDTRNAVKTGILKVVPVKYIWEAFEVATGVALGIKDPHASKKPAKDSCADLIHKRLQQIADYENDHDDKK